MPSLSKAAAEDLRPLIQQMLDDWCAHHNVEFALKIEDVVEQYDWTVFIVKPGGGQVQAYQYAAALAEVESELRREKHVENVRILPVLSD